VVTSVESKSRCDKRLRGYSALIVQSDRSVKRASKRSKFVKLDS
jgi:hypothetical protein